MELWRFEIEQLRSQPFCQGPRAQALFCAALQAANVRINSPDENGQVIFSVQISKAELKQAVEEDLRAILL